jgi:SPP1 family predicted phage head-tail adaptor
MPSSISAGSLNRRITIQAESPTQDESGQPLNSWTDVLHTWASIHAATGKEIFAASGFVSELTHVLTIRFPSVPVHSPMRVLFRGRVFIIQAVSDPTEDRVQLNLLCKELNT